jgi:hypothetical protein
VASLPQQQVDHSQSLTFAIANNARGDSITASVNLPEPHDMVLDGDGLWYTFMDRYGNAAPPVSLEGLDYNPYDDGYTSDLTGDVAVAVAPGPPYAPVAPYSPFAIAYVRDEAYYTDPTAPPVQATETLYVRQFDAYGNQLGNPFPVVQVDGTSLPPGTHVSIHDVKIGADKWGGYTVAWLTDTQVDASYPTHGSRTIDLDVARLGGPTHLVAESVVDTGLYNSGGDYRGHMIAFPDLATNECGRSVVVWADLTNPTTYYFSAYLQTKHIYAQRLDATAALVGPQLQVSQTADTYEASPVPKVAMNDQDSFVVSWCYAPNGPPYMPQLAPWGIYARLYDRYGPVGNEFLVVGSPRPPQQGYYVGHWDHPVGMDAAGNFVVGWFDSWSDPYSYNPPYYARLRAQAYTATGALRGDPFSIVETGDPFPNSVGLDTYQLAMDAAGNFVAAWGNPAIVPGLWRSVVAQRWVQDGYTGPTGGAPPSTVGPLPSTVNPGTAAPAAPVSLAGGSVSGNTLAFDFGPAGLSDVLGADLNGDGALRFDRKGGDWTGLNDPGFMPGLVLNG